MGLKKTQATLNTRQVQEILLGRIFFLQQYSQILRDCCSMWSNAVLARFEPEKSKSIDDKVEYTLVHTEGEIGLLTSRYDQDKLSTVIEEMHNPQCEVGTSIKVSYLRYDEHENRVREIDSCST